MEIELVEIQDFLLGCPPFDKLPAESLQAVASEIEITYLRRGSPFPPVDGHLLIIRQGAVTLYKEEREIASRLAERDLFFEACMQQGLVHRGETDEDTLIYLLSCEILKKLCGEHPHFSAHFATKPGVRLRIAANPDNNDSNSLAAMMVEVGDLLRGEPVTIAKDASIREAAVRMRDGDASSIMVMEDDRLLGLVTDRDLRNRCLADGVSKKTAITSIMTASPTTISADTLVGSAQLTMIRDNIHHLPVLDNGRLRGVFTASALTNQQMENPAFLATDIRRAANLEELANITSRLPNLQVRLCAASASALHIGEAIACITDAITVRLLELAEQQFGPAPVPYVWMAGGSQGRLEQSARSDQDNALLISNRMDSADEPYFAKLAAYVSDGLHRCGFVYCPGKAMATNPQWCQPLARWKQYFDRWIQQPEPMSLMLSSIFFDLRPVHGKFKLFDKMQKYMLGQAAGNGIFLAYMAANAMQHRPPLGFFRNFVLSRNGEHEDVLDIKHGGVVPITDIARVLALSQGIGNVNTTRRLAKAGATSALSKEMASDLRDAMEFIAFLRMQHQANQIQLGTAPDNYLDPKELSPLERGHLKDAFRVVQTMQDALIQRFQAATLV